MYNLEKCTFVWSEVQVFLDEDNMCCVTSVVSHKSMHDWWKSCLGTSQSLKEIKLVLIRIMDRILNL